MPENWASMDKKQKQQWRLTHRILKDGDEFIEENGSEQAQDEITPERQAQICVEQARVHREAAEFNEMLEKAQLA